MADSAAGRPFSGLSEDHAEPAEPERLGELRSLLVGPEQEELRALRYRLDDPDTHALEVSRVLPNAISLRGRDPLLTKALEPTLEQAINASVRRNPHPLADALFPVIGPAIRKAIAHALSTMVESLNKALEHSFSPRALSWRMTAWRTGKSFSEVVLLNTLVYRVEQVFLIHRESGLLLEHAAAGPGLTQDADMVSSMLTAIRDFVHDSFGSLDQDSLEALQVGELSVWVEQGPRAIIAAVVRGNAPKDIRFELQAALESIHLQFAQELEGFSGDTRGFDQCRPILEGCFKTQYRETSGPSYSRRIWIFAGAIALLLAVWLFFYVRDSLRLNRYLARLRSEPGIVVVSSERHAGRHVISGMRDPLAPDPAALVQESGLSPEDVEGHWQFYQALDPGLAERRAVEILQPPPTASLRMTNGTLEAAGQAPAQWVSDSRRLARLIAGVARYDDRNLEASELNELSREVGATMLRFVKGSDRFAPGQDEAVAAWLLRLQQLDSVAAISARAIRLHIDGHTDSDGLPEANEPLSIARAEAIRALLAGRNLSRIEIRTAGLGSSKPLSTGESEEDKQRNRRVTFRLESIRVPQEGPPSR